MSSDSSSKNGWGCPTFFVSAFACWFAYLGSPLYTAGTKNLEWYVEYSAIAECAGVTFASVELTLVNRSKSVANEIEFKAYAPKDTAELIISPEGDPGPFPEEDGTKSFHAKVVSCAPGAKVRAALKFDITDDIRKLQKALQAASDPGEPVLVGPNEIEKLMRKGGFHSVRVRSGKVGRLIPDSNSHVEFIHGQTCSPGDAERWGWLPPATKPLSDFSPGFQ